MTASPATQYVVAFDHRADGGPLLVGPFPGRDDAERWLDTVGCDFEADITTLTLPRPT